MLTYRIFRNEKNFESFCHQYKKIDFSYEVVVSNSINEQETIQIKSAAIDITSDFYEGFGKQEK